MSEKWLEPLAGQGKENRGTFPNHPPTPGVASHGIQNLLPAIFYLMGLNFSPAMPRQGPPPPPRRGAIAFDPALPDFQFCWLPILIERPRGVTWEGPIGSPGMNIKIRLNTGCLFAAKTRGGPLAGPPGEKNPFCQRQTGGPERIYPLAQKPGRGIEHNVCYADGNGAAHLIRSRCFHPVIC